MKIRRMNNQSDDKELRRNDTNQFYLLLISVSFLIRNIKVTHEWTSIKHAHKDNIPKKLGAMSIAGKHRLWSGNGLRSSYWEAGHSTRVANCLEF